MVEEARVQQDRGPSRYMAAIRAGLFRRGNSGGLSIDDKSLEGDVLTEREKTPERFMVAEIRRFQASDTREVLSLLDNETLGHLSPTPYIPDWNNEEDVQKAIFEFYNYAINYPDSPNKLIPAVAVNPQGEIMGFAGMRLRGDAFIPAGRRIAGLERLFVGKEFRKHDVATIFVASLAHEMFTGAYYANGKPAVEIRAWTMEDEQAGDWRKNHGFMKKLGFQPISDSNWPSYRRARGIPDDGRGNATQWKLKREWLEAAREVDSTIQIIEDLKLSNGGDAYRLEQEQ